MSTANSSEPAGLKRQGSGSYLAMRQLKESYQFQQKASLLKHGSRNGFLKDSGSQQFEIQKLQQLNAELLMKLSFAESRVPGLAKALGLDMPLPDGTVHIITTPKGENSCSQPSNEGNTPDATIGPIVIDDLLLTPVEVEEASMKCCYLARYWGLAAQLGICDLIASERAAYWGAMTPSMECFMQSARQAVVQHVNTTQGSEAPQAGPPGIPTGGSSVQPTVADLIEVERGLRQLSDLGVVGEVAASICSSAANGGGYSLFACLQSGAEGELVDPEDPSLCSVPVAKVGALEKEEVMFQRAWLAYWWGRAAAIGIEQQISAQRAEHWAHQLDLPVSVRDLDELAEAQHEIRLLGLEQQIWQSRFSSPPELRVK